MFEAVGGVRRRHPVEDGLHGVPECVARSAGHGSQQLLGLGEDQFNGIQIGAVRGQEHQAGGRLFDQLAHSRTPVARQIVHDHDIARAKIGNEHLLDKRLEHIAVDRSVHDGGTTHSVNSQGRDQSGGFPVTVRCLVDQALSAWCSASKTGHVRLGPCLIDEDQTLGTDFRLNSSPGRAMAGDVRAVLLGRMDRLFLKDNPSR